jgi:hypothetical protein
MQPLSAANTTNTAELDRSFRQKTTHFLSKAERVFQYVLQHKTDPFLMVPIALSVLSMLSVVPILNVPIGLMTIAETSVFSSVYLGLSIAGSCASLHSHYKFSQLWAKAELQNISTVEKVKRLFLMASSEFWDMDTGYFITSGCVLTLIALGTLLFPASLIEIFLRHTCANFGVGSLLYGTRVAAERAYYTSKYKELIRQSNDLFRSFSKNQELYIHRKIPKPELERLEKIHNKKSLHVYRAMDELEHTVLFEDDHLSTRLFEINQETNLSYRLLKGLDK